MPDITQALALYDTADQIDRLRFQLCALPSAPAVPSPWAVASQVRTLAEITAGISDQITRLPADPYAPPTRRAINAFSAAVLPLGEATAELGEVQSNAVVVNDISPHTGNPDTKKRRELAVVELTEHRDAAAGILQVTAEGLRTAATRLARPQDPLQVAARARSPHAPNAASAAPHTAAPASPTPTRANPHAPKGR
jgi:hypothetical protein